METTVCSVISLSYIGHFLYLGEAVSYPMAGRLISSVLWQIFNAVSGILVEDHRIVNAQ